MMINSIPTILALIAGFIVCVVTFIYGYTDISWLIILIFSMLFFWIVGLILVKVLNKELVEPDYNGFDEFNEESDEEVMMDGEFNEEDSDSFLS